MAVTTDAPFRRVIGTLIRGVGDGLAPTVGGIPLAGATVVCTAFIRSAKTSQLIVLDPVIGTTDHKAVLRSATTGEVGLPLLVTDNPSIGSIGWTWHIEITAPSLPRPIEFDIPVPTGTGDLNLALAAPAAASGGGVTLYWLFKGPTPPPNPVPGMVWMDTSNPWKYQMKTWE